MAIDDNSWDAGYECGLRDQKKADAAEVASLQAHIDILAFSNSQQFWEIAGLNQQIGVLQALLASRCKLATDEVNEKIQRGGRLTDHRFSL